MKKKIWVIFFYYFLSLLQAQEQSFKIKRYDQHNGLPSKKLYSITTDKNGFIWMSSENGVFRFDGKTFYNYTIKDSLCDNEIFKAFADKKGNIWCTGYNGKISIIEDGFINNNYDFIKKWNSKSFIYNVVEDDKENIYLLGERSQLYKIDKNKNVKQISTEKITSSIDKICVYNKKIRLISFAEPHYFYLDEKGQAQPDSVLINKTKGFSPASFYNKNSDIWVTKSGKSIFNLNNNIEIDSLEFKPYDIKTIFETSHSFICFSLNNGNCFLYYLPSKRFQKIPIHNNEVIQDFTEDNNGNIWLSGANGSLFYLKFDPVRDLKTNNLIEGNYVCAFADTDKIFAVDLDNYLYVIKKNEKIKYPLSNDETHVQRLFNASFQKYNNKLYVNTANGIFKYNNNTIEQFLSFNVKAFCIGNNKLFYFMSNALYARSLEDRFLQEAIPPVIFDRLYTIFLKDTLLWLSKKEGLYYFDISKQKLSSLIYKVPDNGRIEKIDLWNDDTLALCTNNKGVLLLNKNKIVKIINTETGLYDNTCKEIDKCAKGWIVKHPLGLSFIDKKNNQKILTISHWKDIPISTINNISIFNDSVVLSSSQGLIISSITDLFK